MSNIGNNTIEKFTPGGVRSVFASSELNIPVDLAFDGVGNLYAANFEGQNIVKFTPAGANSIFAGGLRPSALAFDSAGSLFVADAIDNTIKRFALDGSGGTVFVSTGSGQTSSLAFDEVGNLYASKTQDNVSRKFNPSGVGSDFATTGLNVPRGIALTDDAGVPLRFPIPEPSSCTLAVLACFATMARRQRSA